MPDTPNRKRLLLLGGTREARQLAEALSSDPTWLITSSLAGITRTPDAIAGDVRTGGFGGRDGLVKYLTEHRIDVVADATHPYATTISRNAQTAAAAIGCRYLRLCRPPWQPDADDTWIGARDVADAASCIAPDASVFLTIGRQQLAPFMARRDITLVARIIEPPDSDVTDNVTVILARPPFALADEIALMRRHAVDTLVTKNAGGSAVAAKLAAARQLGLSVIMIARPEGQPPVDAETVAEMRALLASLHHDT